MAYSTEARPDLPRQQTLAAPVGIEGVGLHTGCGVRLRLLPAPSDTGVCFVTPQGLIPAVSACRVPSNRCTMLAAGEARVQTTEHLLAALFGCGITNARVEIDGPEVPAMDGSALPFVEAILQAGISAQAAPARVIHLAAPVWISEGEKQVLALPAPALKLTAAIDFGRPLAGPSVFSYDTAATEGDERVKGRGGEGVRKKGSPVTPSPLLPFSPSSALRFARELAPARTFCFADEVAAILAAGMGAGGTLENALVLSETETSAPLRFPDELARHKALDLLGDLALLGALLAAHVIAIKGGHALHGAAVDEIRRTVYDEG